MQNVLLNMANWLMIEFCKEYKINCSDSFAKKDGRGFKYALCDYPTGKPFLTIEFTKNSTPKYNYIKGQR